MNIESPNRAYKQTVRAKAAEETGERILDAFTRHFERGWFEDIRLEDVARDAGVTVQTVIRRFGGKEGLLNANSERIDRLIRAERQLPVGDVGRIIDVIVAEYELRGELVMRLLAQEDRYPEIMGMADWGRRVHREWTGKVFAPWLSRLKGEERRRAHDRLVIALDAYVWKLIRVDMKRSMAELRKIMLEMVAAALGTTPEILQQPRSPETANA